nr:hypothetical protein [Candidatus Omnitrophota bacterium]
YYLLEVQSQDWTAEFQNYLGGLTQQLKAQGTRLVLYNADTTLNPDSRRVLYDQITAWAKAFSTDAVQVSAFAEPNWSSVDLVGKVTRDIKMTLNQSIRVDLNVNKQTQVLPKDLVLQGAVTLARQYGVVIASTNPVLGVTQEITMAEILGNTLAAFEATAASA